MRNKKAELLLFFIIVVSLSSGCIFNGLFNNSPVVEAISNQIGKVDREFIYQVVAYDPDNGELTYSLTEKPEGMQIGSSTGMINWTPEESHVGTFTVEVKVSNGNSFEVKTFEITIEDIYLTSIEVSPADIDIYVGNSKTITSVATYYDNGESTDLSLADCIYDSADTDIATVNNGMITGVSAGLAIVNVSYTENGITRTDTVNITVEDISLTSIIVFPSTMSIVVGNYKDITSITAHYNDGSSVSIPDSASYSSNNTGIASVSTTGRVTGVSAGLAIVNVSYTENGITRTDTVNITVEDISLTSISVLPTNMNMFVGSTKNITSITAHYDDGNSISIELTLAAYQTSNTNATVNNNGLITGISTGAVIITVSYTEGGITKTDTVSVTVIFPGGGGGGG